LDPVVQALVERTQKRGSGGQQRGGSGGPPLLGPSIGGEERDGAILEIARELVVLDVEVQADADYRPAVLGAGLDQYSRQLAALYVDVVGPLDLAVEVGA